VFVFIHPIHAQGRPTIPVGLADPYLMFVPVGWGTADDSPFGFVTASNGAITLNVLDPTRLEQYLPYNPDTSPRRLLMDYWRFFYAQSINRLDIELLTIGNNTVAIYPDPDNPQLATYIVELVNQRFALIEINVSDSVYDDEREAVHTILETLSTSIDGEIRTDVIVEPVILPSDRYTLNMPINWFIEPSLAPGQLFIVGDGIETIMLPPDTVAASFDLPADVNLADLAQVIETELFETDITNIDINLSQIGDRQVIAYGFRSISTQTDTQVIMVRLPTGDIAYYRTTSLQDSVTSILADRLRRVAVSLQPYITDEVDLFTDDIRGNLIPNSGEWRVTPREMMRVVCDGDLVEQLTPLTPEIRGIFSDFDTIVADPDGESITLANDGITSLFQRGTLQREGTPYYQILGDNIGYILTPQSDDVMIGRLNIIAPDVNGANCRFGVSITLRFVA